MGGSAVLGELARSVPRTKKKNMKKIVLLVLYFLRPSCVRAADFTPARHCQSSLADPNRLPVASTRPTRGMASNKQAFLKTHAHQQREGTRERNCRATAHTG